MDILIQKFGGTSVRDKKSRRHVIEHIQRAIHHNYKVIVVVSAPGRLPEPYATDSLLALADFPENHTAHRELDMLMSCGETISSVILTSELQTHNVTATALTGPQAGIITNDHFNQAKIKEVKPKRVYDELEKHDVVVVAGFQGVTKTGDITTLGRGGSDTTAASLGAATQAKGIEIFTDVNGIMTADPRIVKKARSLDAITYMEICHLAYQGAKVVHPRAVEIAMQAEVPMRVRSTYSNDSGTLVTSSRLPTGVDIPDRLITGFAYIDAITQIQVKMKAGKNSQANVFNAMAEAGISIDFINISPTEVVYTVPNDLTEKAENILKTIGYEPVINKDCAKVSAVGAGMTGVPGVASRIVETLMNEDIQILQSADSHTTIWVLIKEKDLTVALNALHEEFGLSEIKKQPLNH